MQSRSSPPWPVWNIMLSRGYRASGTTRILLLLTPVTRSKSFPDVLVGTIKMSACRADNRTTHCKYLRRAKLNDSGVYKNCRDLMNTADGVFNPHGMELHNPMKTSGRADSISVR